MKNTLWRTVLPVLAVALLTAACAGTSSPLEATTTTTTEGSEATTATTAADSTAVSTVATHDESSDFEWSDENVVDVILADGATSSDDASVIVAGSTVTITAPGTYRLTGTLSDGSVVVDSAGDGVVRLILDGVDITSSTNPAISAVDAEKVIVVLADGTENRLTDGATRAETDADSNGALFSRADLTIGGGGSLTVEGRYNDGIASTDGLVVSGGTITVVAVDDGIRGKDYLVVDAGAFDVTAGGDGLKSDNEEDSNLGYIAIAGGTFSIASEGDAIVAQTSLLIESGEYAITTGADLDSAKALKAEVDLTVQGGVFTIDATDDAIHSNANVIIDGGTFTIATGDDGVHADASIIVNGGSIDITESYEGLESATITLVGGELTIVSSDDGLNVVGGNDQSGFGGRGGGPGRGDDSFATSGDQWMHIEGATVVVYADGDGIDINGSFAMTDGTLIVHGPTANNNGALDVDGGIDVSGGLLVAAGSAGMAEAPDTSSAQAYLGLQFGGAQPAGTVIQIESGDGTILLTFEPAKAYQTLVFSSPDLVAGDGYSVLVGGSGAGDELGGVYSDVGELGTNLGSITAA